MAINMLNEDSIVRCSKCGFSLLFLNKMYTLEKVQTKEGARYKKVLYKSKWTCANCNTDIPIYEKDMLTT